MKRLRLCKTDLKLSASISTIREAASCKRISLKPWDWGEPRELFSVHDRRTSKKESECVFCGVRQVRQHLMGPV